MTEPKRFFVALDGSPRSADVLAQAVALARCAAGKVRLFRAVPVQPEVPWDLVHQFPPGGREALFEQYARADLDAHAKSVPPELLDGVATAVGVPWRAICKAASDWGADLVVIGSHGYHGLDRVLGTTAVRVVEHAERSVLVVRA